MRSAEYYPPVFDLSARSRLAHQKRRAARVSKSDTITESMLEASSPGVVNT